MHIQHESLVERYVQWLDELYDGNGLTHANKDQFEELVGIALLSNEMHLLPSSWRESFEHNEYVKCDVFRSMLVDPVDWTVNVTTEGIYLIMSVILKSGIKQEAVLKVESATTYEDFCEVVDKLCDMYHHDQETDYSIEEGSDA